MPGLGAVVGDFFAAVPRGDGYVLSHIVRDRDDERSRAILRTCTRTSTRGSHPPTRSRSERSSRCASPAAERTEAEYRELLRVSGFLLELVLATRSPAHIIDSVKV